MIRIAIVCRHCQSEHLVCNGHAANGKQRYRCRTCGRQSRADPCAPGHSEVRRQEILHAYQERSSLRGLQRTFGVSRNTVVKWIKKKFNTCLPCRKHCWPLSFMTPWNSTNSGPLFSAKSTRCGYGLPCVAVHDKWLLTLWVIAAI